MDSNGSGGWDLGDGIANLALVAMFTSPIWLTMLLMWATGWGMR